MNFRNLKEIGFLAADIRKQFELRTVNLEILKKAYVQYNTNVEIDSFVQTALKIFPKLNCGLASAYIHAFLRVGQITSGSYKSCPHTFLLMKHNEDQILIDITSDQYGGPKVYVGPVIKPWCLPTSVTIDKIQILEDLRKSIPFLTEVPDSIYFYLDPGEFFVPDKTVNRLRKELEQKLGHHVMTYKKGVLNLQIPPEKHLCANVKPAKLSKRKLDILNNFESRLAQEGVSFVVYHKPLTLIEPYTSKLYEFYLSRSLNLGLTNAMN